MSALRYIHCADLHIDSPFKGIGQVHPGFRDTLYDSTYRSFTKITDLALSQEVDFVVICGDIYDSADKSLKAQLHFRDELSRLADAGIPAYVVHGNHDPLDGWSASLKWPDNVIIFGGESVGHADFQRDGITIARIYGISYKVRDVSDNLSLQFRHLEADFPAIALLHANIGSNTAHKSYAPASVDDLLGRGISYWALGHVHQRSILRDASPAIVYPGNSQARHPRETGAKGCYLINMEADGSCSMRFVETDLVRYESRNLNIENIPDIDELTTYILSLCDDVTRESSGRAVVLRLTLVGRSALHGELNRGENIVDLQESIQEQLLEGSSKVLLNQVRLESSSPYDINELRRGNDFVADLISLFDDLGDSDSQQWNSIRSALEPLYQTWQGHRLLDGLSDQQLKEIALQGMHQTLDGIVETE